MDQKRIQNFKRLVADFRALTTKLQKDYLNKTKSLKETNFVRSVRSVKVLEACKTEYQKLYLEYENLRKKY